MKPQPGATGVVVAPLGPRFGAAVLDRLGPAVIGGLWSFIVTRGVEGWLIYSVAFGLALFAWTMVQWWAYATRKCGLGYRVFRLELVGLANGKPIGWGRMALRTLVFYALWALVLPGIVMAIFLVVQERRQGWHDLAAGSLAIARRKNEPAPQTITQQHPGRRTTTTVGLPPHLLDNAFAGQPSGVGETVAPISQVPLAPAAPQAGVGVAEPPRFAPPQQFPAGQPPVPQFGPGAGSSGPSDPAGPGTPGSLPSAGPQGIASPYPPAQLGSRAQLGPSAQMGPSAGLPLQAGAMEQPPMGATAVEQTPMGPAAGLPQQAGAIEQPPMGPSASFVPRPAALTPPTNLPSQPVMPALPPVLPQPSSEPFAAAAQPSPVAPPAPVASPGPLASAASSGPPAQAASSGPPELPVPRPRPQSPATTGGSMSAGPKVVPSPPKPSSPPLRIKPRPVPSDEEDGTRLVTAPSRGVRPAGEGWHLRLDDGREVALAGLVLIGRAPEARPGEPAPTLIAAGGPDHTVSKTHLALDVDAKGPFLIDRGSTNGTAVLNDKGELEPCQAHSQVRLREGQVISFGERQLQLVRRPPKRG